MSGGYGRNSYLASTEILKKEGGKSWQAAASLPSARRGLKGVSLSNGHFMVSGEELRIVQYLPCYFIIMQHHYRRIRWSQSCWSVDLWSRCRQVDQSGPPRQGPQWTWHEPRAQGDCWLLCRITCHWDYWLLIKWIFSNYPRHATNTSLANFSRCRLAICPKDTNCLRKCV